MSTRSNIAQVRPDGTVKALYVHFDGYLEGVGQQLVDWLGGQTLERRKFVIDKLMAEPVGWSSISGKDIDLDPGWTEFKSKGGNWSKEYESWHSSEDYKRLQSYSARGEETEEDHIFGSLKEYLRSLYGDVHTEYVYVFGAEYLSMGVYELEHGDSVMYPGRNPGYHQRFVGVVNFTDPALNEEIAGNRKDIRLILGIPLSEEE